MLQHKYGQCRGAPQTLAVRYTVIGRSELDRPIFLSPVMPSVTNLGVRGRAPSCRLVESFFKKYHKLSYYCAPISDRHAPFFSDFLY